MAHWIHPVLFAGGAKRWSPLDLGALLELWLDASQIEGHSDGDPVGLWPDLSGNARDVTAGGGLRPTYREAVQNGLAVVEFDGVGHQMTMDFSTPVAPGNLTIICALNHQGDLATSDDRLMDTTTGRLIVSLMSNAVGVVGYYDTAWRNIAPAMNGPQVLTWLLDVGGAEMFRNGRAIGPGAFAARGFGGATKLSGNKGGVSSLVEGTLWELLICSTALGAGVHAQAINYLLDKWADEYFYYLIYDTFTDINGTDLDAHVPEKGAWTEVDTGGLCDIQSNKAQITGAGVYTDPLFYAGPFPRVTGAELVFTIKPGQLNQQMGIALWDGLNFDPGTGDKEHLMWFFSDGNIYCREAVEPAAVAYTTDEVECKIVLKAVGAEYWYNGVMVADLAVNSGGPLYVGVAAKGGTWDFDFISYNMPA